MYRATAYIAIALAFGSRAVPAQQMNALTDLSNATWEGIHLYGVNVFTSYVSSAFPVETTTVIAPNAAQLGHDVTYGASVNVGWQYHRGERLGINMAYAGSYTRSQNFNSLSSFGHSFRANAFWELTQKLTLTASANANYATLAEYVYQPTSLSITAQSPATINNVAASMGVGQFSNTQSASALSAATPAGVSNQTSLLLGNRILTYATQASLGYQATSRLSFSFAAVSAAGQNRNGGVAGAPPQTYVVPRTFGLMAGGSVGLALTPRTDIAINFGTSRNSTLYQSGYSTTAGLSMGRMMGTRWFLRGSGGAAYSWAVQQQQGTPKAIQLTAGGSVGYGLNSQTFLANYNRSSTDINGFAIGTNTHLAGAWGWHRPDRAWNMSASFGQQLVRNTGFTSLTGWNGGITWYTHLVAGTMLTMQYVYSSSTGNLFGYTTKVTVNSVRLTIGWVPAALQAAAQATGASLRQQP